MIYVQRQGLTAESRAGPAGRTKGLNGLVTSLQGSVSSTIGLNVSETTVGQLQTRLEETTGVAAVNKNGCWLACEQDRDAKEHCLSH
ncbi:hypothetical protein WJX84_007976 [Apatococcus fuscideae]|uniref:Uncharacterized protein n=1 Tax=Apatococcus fuscideae TaxID=2026836 RepID=A0AAW1S6K5_9CHLO